MRPKESTISARIVIVDDHPIVREGLTLRISTQPDLEVCGEAETEDEALVLVQTTQPDLVIVDISLKSGHGIDLINRLKSLEATPKVLVLSGFQESLYAERAMRAGALGYLNKQESNDKLIVAIRTVLAGKHYVSPDLGLRLVSQALGKSSEVKNPRELLSVRELEIFRLIGQGQSSGAIASRLFLSTHTIDTHRENIKRKLDIKTAGALTRVAVLWVQENG